jgi:trehalose 6-phosphate synthase
VTETSSEPSSRRIVVAANRLPVRWDDDESRWVTSPGGLVTALAPVLRERKGLWVGWSGMADRVDEPFEVDGIRQVPITLSTRDVEDYYEGFCNGTIWPLYHDAIRPVEMHRHWWRPYQEINRRFADGVVSAAEPGDAIWIQDYQLQLVPSMVREQLGHDVRIGFFLHIPFPPLEIFGRLPWREEVVRGLLGADVVGFQTRQSVLNFARSARAFGGATGPAEALHVDGRIVRAESVPIAIDTADFRSLAVDHSTVDASHRLREELGNPEHILLGVDRLDYTKGIDIRLRAFETLLEQRPDLLGKVVLVQVAVPSREGVGEYQVIRERVEQLVGRINGAFGLPDWTPVHYRYRGLPREELIAYYRAADVMLITPLRDGMNLVAKEYVASRVDGTGVLVLSEFAGSAEQLDRALIVNPYDIDALADTLGTAIDLPLDEQRRRMGALRRHVDRWDVHTWATHCLEALGA